MLPLAVTSSPKITHKPQDNESAAHITAQYGLMPDAPFTTGILFVKSKDANNTDTIAYYQHDHLGTPVQAVNKAGHVVYSATTHAFGRTTVVIASTAENPTITSNLRLPGQLEDTETGLHYNYHRYYDPDTGRYTTRDPIGLAGGLNAYVYARGSPVNWVDPDGL